MKNFNEEHHTQQSETQTTLFQAIICWLSGVLHKANAQDWPVLCILALSLQDWVKSKTEGNNIHLIIVSVFNTAHTIYIKQSLGKTK